MRSSRLFLSLLFFSPMVLTAPMGNAPQGNGAFPLLDHDRHHADIFSDPSSTTLRLTPGGGIHVDTNSEHKGFRLASRGPQDLTTLLGGLLPLGASDAERRSTPHFHEEVSQLNTLNRRNPQDLSKVTGVLLPPSPNSENGRNHHKHHDSHKHHDDFDRHHDFHEHHDSAKPPAVPGPTRREPQLDQISQLLSGLFTPPPPSGRRSLADVQVDPDNLNTVQNIGSRQIVEHTQPHIAQAGTPESVTPVPFEGSVPEKSAIAVDVQVGNADLQLGATTSEHSPSRSATVHDLDG